MMETSTQTDSAATTVLWPPERFYWAEIDAMGWSGSGTLPPGLLLALADELPLPIEDLQAVGIPVDGGRVLICACPRESLTALDPAIVELKPAAIPEGLAAPGSLSGINLLVGDCEPAAKRAARRSYHSHIAITVLACSLLVMVGLYRRAQGAAAGAIQATKAADSVLADSGTPRREDSLTEKAKVMRSIADAAKRAKPAADAAAALQALLKVWPTQFPAKPQNLSVNADGISLSVAVDGDPAPFLKSLTPPAGFVLDEPRIATAGSVTRLSLHWRSAPTTPSVPTTVSTASGPLPSAPASKPVSPPVSSRPPAGGAE